MPVVSQSRRQRDCLRSMLAEYLTGKRQSVRSDAGGEFSVADA